ncbi:EscV/YscV/HrcV family type III secretion system export apparatus protein [Pseudomonas batumici]|uniref:EscV/YscV/HrcV family type III secretion system export apparatus protein n=1 Tax=Pseudomonas batumici TaxID=226910 RepID=UPI0030CF7A5C
MLKKLAMHPELAIVFLMVMIIAMLIIPLPTYLVDLLLGLNITLSILIFVGSFYIGRVLDLSAFPSILLITTLFRLALSISTSRLILQQADGGQIIESFGDFVIGGDLVIGLTIFAIVTIVQFIVITKGSERVAEVCARFSLDGLPGKQMSIDADLRAGVIDGEAAKQRRSVLEKESQLYGSLDGAMKFIKGDAIAGIVIILVNFIGGIAVGMSRHDFSFNEALNTYTLLTIGDGLVAQIPALLISISAGFIVTKVAGEGQNLGVNIVNQLTSNPFVLLVVAVLCLAMGLVPGFPSLVFIGLAAGVGLLYFARTRGKNTEDGELGGEGGGASEKSTMSIDQMLTDTLPLMLLIPEGQREHLPLDLAESLAKSTFLELGLKLPAIEVRESPTIAANQGVLLINEVRAGELNLVFGQSRVVSGMETLEALGIPTQLTQDSNGQSTCWVDPQALPSGAREMGIVVSAVEDDLRSGFIAAVSRNVGELFGIQETKNLLDEMERKYPELLKEAYRNAPVQRITEILQRLLKEQISIRNMKVVLEAITHWAGKERDTIMLVEHVRGALGRYITSKFARGERLRAIVTSSDLEESVRKGIRQSSAGTFLNLEPEESEGILDLLAAEIGSTSIPLRDAVFLTAVDVRRFFKRLIEQRFPEMEVLSYGEVTDMTKIDVLKTV